MQRKISEAGFEKRDDTENGSFLQDSVVSAKKMSEI
jgi:hypothetical protein